MAPFGRSLVFAAAAGLALSAQWTDISTGLPATTAGVRALVIDNSGSTLYACTTSGSLFKSSDAGASWTAISNIAGVLALAIDPTSPSTVYAGLRKGVFKSNDGGASWQAVGVPDTSFSRSIVVDPSMPSTIYASDGTKLYKSSDGGALWEQIGDGLPPGPPGFPFLANLTVDPANPSTLYVLAGVGPSGSTLYKSANGGGTWNQINSGLFAPPLVVASDSTVYANRFDRSLVRSTDGGVTFTATGFKSDFTALTVDPTDSNTLYAGKYGPNQSIIKTTDGGQTWDTVNTSAPPTAILVVNPADPSGVYAATFTGGVFKSVDRGANWYASNNGFVVRNLHVLAVDPSNAATVYTGGDDGLFKSTDGGANWTQRTAFELTLNIPTLPNGMPPPPSAIPPFPPLDRASVQSLLIDYKNPANLYIGTHRTGGCFFTDLLLYKSSDAGANWDNSVTPKESGCLADALLAIDPADPKTLYLRWGDDFDGFGIAKTEGGASWGFANAPANGSALNALAIDPKASSTLYGATDFGVFKSLDAGAHWANVGLSDVNATLLNIDPVNTSTVYAVANSVFKSTDAGATWSGMNQGLEDVLARSAGINALVVNPSHTSTLYLATSGFGVFRSTDAGATWQPYNDGLANFDVGLLAISNSTPAVVYAATSGGVFRLMEDEAAAVTYTARRPHPDVP